MQDSIEDYIRISKNTKEGPPPPPQVKKEVLITAQIKKECDAKAMQILQFAIEGKMRSDALFRCLPYINQSHYQDIVEERAITKLCGYPLCSKKIPDMPKKQFYISTKSNKVYDITDRKNYCSNFCYRASLHIKKQIDTSPLWLRKHDEKRHFTLLNKSEKGLPGELVDQGIRKPVAESLFTSVHSFAEMSLDEAEENELTQEEKESKSQLKKPKKFQKIPMKTINENEEEEQNELDNDSSVINETKEPSNVDTINVIKIPENDSKENKKKPENNSKAKTNKTNDTETENQIIAVFKDWLTLETYMFIHGEEKVKEKLDSKKLSDYFETLKIAELQVEQQKRYIDICRKLHLKELAEEKFFNDVTGNSKLRPIPDYPQLKEESKELDLKVKCFFSGELHIKEDPNFPQKKTKTEASNEEEGPPAIMPLVEVNSQNALRRKIFLNSLNKTVQTLFQILRLSPNLVLSDLQALVKTFKLKPDNIVFKPHMWNYITIILLKILSLNDENLLSILEEDRSKSQINLWLSPLPHKTKIIDDVLKILQDIDSFVENYIICK